MEIENIPISEIKPYEKNPRKNEKAVEIVAKSIKEFGFKVPIILDKKNEIIAGHTRLKAAIKLGLKEVPVIWADELTDAQVKAFRIMDNKSNEFAEWDTELLKGEMDELDKMDFDLDLTGFDKTQRELVGTIEEFEDVPNVDDEGETIALNDVIIIQLKDTAQARKIREFLGLAEKKKSIKGEEVLKAIRRS